MFTKQLMSVIQKIESKVYTVLNIQVSFSFELAPSDMKFAATYFSSFANVSHSDITSLSAKLGTSWTCKWKPWRYEDRLTVAKQMAQFKKRLSNNVTKTNRTKITKLIASKNSRQEFFPLIGRLCDKAVVEPLHLKSNTVQHLHSLILKVVLSISSLPANLSNLSELPQSNPMMRYLKAMECDVKAGRLKKQLAKWLIDDRSRDKDFSYRFTGKDSKFILQGFMYLLNAIRGDSPDLKLLSKLLFLSFAAIKLRDCSACFSMYSLSEENLLNTSSLAHDYFFATVLFSVEYRKLGSCSLKMGIWEIWDRFRN